MYRATDYDKDVFVVASPVSTWRGASSFSPPVGPEMNALGWIVGLVMGFAACLQGWNPNGCGCVIPLKAFASLPSSDSAALPRIHTLQARRASVVHGRHASLVSSRSSLQRALDVDVAFFSTCIGRIAASHLQWVPSRLVCALLTESRSSFKSLRSRIPHALAAIRQQPSFTALRGFIAYRRLRNSSS